MNPADFTTCAYCPRLCRHVCPVAVATGREAATASAMMAAPLLLARREWSAEDALAATDLCVGCGACTEHCKVHVPVADRLSAWRAEQVGVPAAAPLASVEGEGSTVCILTGEDDWSAAWGALDGRVVATLRTSDSLGHTAWKAGNVEVPARVARLLAGRTVVTGSGAVAAVAAAAGLAVERLPAPAGARVFRACHDGAPTPGDLACCGRRGGLPARATEVADEVAAECVRRLGGEPAVCADEECARWLRDHGGAVVGPTDVFAREGTDG